VKQLVWLFSLIALFSVAFAPVAVRAFDVPGMGDGDSGSSKKKKKKKDDSNSDNSNTDSNSSSNNSKSDTSKSDSTAAKAGGAADGDAQTRQANCEAMIEKALLAYNSDDAGTMSPDFSGGMDKDAYKNIYAPYTQKFGKYVGGSKKYVKMASNFVGNAGKLGFNGEFEKHKKACIDCTMALKDGKWRIVGLDFGDDAYPEEGGNAGNGVVMKGNMTEIKVPKSLWDKTDYYKNIKVGDFLEYETPEMPGMKSRMEVTEIGDHTLTMLTKQTIPGVGVQEAKSKQIFSEPDPETKDVKDDGEKVTTKTFDDKIKIGSKGEFAATRTECYQGNKLLSKTWTCKDVPLGGMVKGEGPDGKAYTQLVDFGRGK
jgi:hypothetical protein